MTVELDLAEVIGQDGCAWDYVARLVLEWTGKSDDEIAYRVEVFTPCTATKDKLTDMGLELIRNIEDRHDKNNQEFVVVLWRGRDIADAVEAFKYYRLRCQEVL